MPRAHVCAQCISNDFAQIAEYKVWRYGSFERLYFSAISEHCRLCTILASAVTSNLAKVYNIEGETVPTILQAWGDGKDNWQVLVFILNHALGDMEHQMKGRLWVVVARPDYVDLVLDTMENLQRSRSISFGGLFSLAKAGKNMMTGFWRHLQDPTPSGPVWASKTAVIESHSSKTPDIARAIPFSSAADPGALDMVRKWMADCRIYRPKSRRRSIVCAPDREE